MVDTIHLERHDPDAIRPSLKLLTDWQFEPALKAEIELRFIADGNSRTRVEFEHRYLDRYGSRRDEMRRIYDTEGDWGNLLEAFVRAAEA